MTELEWLSGIYQEFLRDFTVRKKAAVWTLPVPVWVWPFANTLSKHTDKLFMFGAQSMWVQRSALRWRERKSEGLNKARWNYKSCLCPNGVTRDDATGQ